MLRLPRQFHAEKTASRSSCRRQAASGKRSTAAESSSRLSAERLEPRSMLTATLYVDFGDRFPGGSITGVTVGDFETQALGPGMYGDPNFPFQPTDSLQLDSMASIYTVNAASIRADAMSLLRRYYEPFDITVVDLTADFQNVNGHNVRAAATLADAAATLAINNAGPKHNDAYVFVSRYLINGANLLEKAFRPNSLNLSSPTALSGLANGQDSGGFNANDGTATVFLRNAPSSNGFSFAATIAHEAGHLFGLDHVYRTNSDDGFLINIPGTAIDAEILYGSELMSYSQIKFDKTFAKFMRYPTTLGEDNKNYNALSTAAPTKSPVEQFLVDAEIGRGTVEYVTGTGANDIITLVRNTATQATVTVEAFTDASFSPSTAIPVPGLGGTAYTYVIDLTRPVIVDAGVGDDRIVVDGDLGTQITVRGMKGEDSMIVMGKNASAAIYAPGASDADGLDGQPNRRGTVTIGATAIRFEEFESSPVDIRDVASLTYITPPWSVGGRDDDVTVDNATSGQLQIRTGDSVGRRTVPLILSNVGGVVIDMATNDSGTAELDSDSVSVNAQAGPGLASLRILSGSGADFFFVNSWSGAAPLVLEAGDADDQISVGAGDLNSVIASVVADGGAGSNDQITVLDNFGNGNIVDYLVTPTSVTSTNSPNAPGTQPARTFGGLTYSGSTEFLAVFGTDGPNVFDVQPSVDTRYFINGNLPAPGSVPAGDGDFLKLDTKTTFPAHPDGLDTSGRRLSMTARGAGRWDFTAGTGHEPVEFESIERFNHVDRIAVAPDAGRTSSPVVRVHDAETMALLFEIPATATYGAGYRDGVRVATGDLDNDGIPDVVTAPGRMAAPVIKVFSGAPIPGLEGSEIAGLRLPAAATYGDGYKGGVHVAVGDVVGDRLNDIVITPDRGKAIVKVFRTRLVAGDPSPTNLKTASHSFDAFADFPRFIGGANVATADLLGNGRSRIVVGSGSGMEGLVRVFDVRSAVSPYTATQTISGIFERGLGGVRVAAGDIDGDGRDDLLMGSGPAGGTWLKARRGGTLSGELFQFQIASGRGSTVPTRFALRDVNGDGRAEVFAAFGADARTGYRLVRLRNRQAGELDSLNVVSAAFSGGGVNLG